MTYLERYLKIRGLFDEQIATRYDTPITGVISCHSLNSFFLDDTMSNSVDLLYEEYIEENGEEAANEYDSDHGEYILGFKKNKEGLWVEDKDEPISLIYYTDRTDIQILHSRFIKIGCRPCSPCYPGQADLDSSGGTLVAYCVSPEDTGESYSIKGIIHQEMLFIEKIPRDDLPLYVSHKWETEMGREFFAHRFKEKTHERQV